MDSLFVLGIILAVLGGLVSWRIWQKYRVTKAKGWPKTEATIQSGGIDIVAQRRYISVVLPCFAFSYVVDGEYFSGRFALSATGDQADDLIKEMIDRRFIVNYDPEKPSTFYIPDEFIEGCEVYQKLSDKLIPMYPTS
jgi:hypothetical protein